MFTRRVAAKEVFDHDVAGSHLCYSFVVSELPDLGLPVLCPPSSVLCPLSSVHLCLLSTSLPGRDRIS